MRERDMRRSLDVATQEFLEVGQRGCMKAGRLQSRAAFQLSLRSVHGSTPSPSAMRGDIVDRNIAFGPLDRAEIRAVDASLVGERFLTEPALGAESAHVLRQNVPQGSFVRPLHRPASCPLTFLRRPLLSYILPWTGKTVPESAMSPRRPSPRREEAFDGERRNHTPRQLSGSSAR
jgi:hypothetical protein